MDHVFHGFFVFFFFEVRCYDDIVMNSLFFFSLCPLPDFLLHFPDLLRSIRCDPIRNQICFFLVTVLNEIDIIKGQHGIRDLHEVFFPGRNALQFAPIIIRKISHCAGDQRKLALILIDMVSQVVSQIIFKGDPCLFFFIDKKFLPVLHQFEVRAGSNNGKSSKVIDQRRIQEYTILLRCQRAESFCHRYICS